MTDGQAVIWESAATKELNEHAKYMGFDPDMKRGIRRFIVNKAKAAGSPLVTKAMVRRLAEEWECGE